MLIWQDFPTLLANPHLLAVLERFFSYPRRLVALAAYDHNVGNGNRSFPLDYAPLTILGIGPGMSFNKINLFHDNPVFLGKDTENFTRLPFFLSSDNHHQIVCFDMVFRFIHRFLWTPRTWV